MVRRAGCSTPRGSTPEWAESETSAGQFMPYAVSPPSPTLPTTCLRCWALPDACLEVLPVPKTQWVYDSPKSNSLGVGMYPPKKRPFRLHVAGLSAAELHTLMTHIVPSIKDPLNSQFLRHLERDVVWFNKTDASASRWPLFETGGRPAKGGGAAGEPGADDELVMVWPWWEKGYGDVIANTLLPFGEMLRRARFPRNLALSGMRFSTLIPPLRASTQTLCATERENPPLLPRCASTCWSRVRICAPEFFESTRDSWYATAALDAASAVLQRRGLDAPPDPAAAVAAAVAASANASLLSRQPTAARGPLRPRRAARLLPTKLRVLIASRSGRRLLANDRALTAACNGRTLNGTRLVCTLLPADAPQAAKELALRQTDVYVCVWGGDTVHSLHMRFGASVVELRPSGFAKGAPWNWLELHRRWVSRLHGGDRLAPASRNAIHPNVPLHFRPVLLPTNMSVIGTAERQCFEKNARRRAQLIAAKSKRIPQDDWLCYWNANLVVDFEELIPALHAHLRGLQRDALMMNQQRDALMINRWLHRGGS